MCIECTPSFDVDMLEELLAPAYVGSHAITCPLCFGLPVRRHRLYMWFDLTSTLDEVHVDPDGLFFSSCRSVRMSPRCYLSATTSERRGYYAELRSQQHGDDEPLPTGSAVLRHQRKNTAPPTG